MRLTNKTGWRTDDLRRFIAAACRQDGIEPSSMTVEVRHTRQRRGCSGFAWLDSRSMVVRLPRPVDGESELTDDLRHSFARVTLHELAHCRGVTHAEMDPALRSAGSFPTPWADDYPSVRNR